MSLAMRGLVIVMVCSLPWLSGCAARPHAFQLQNTGVEQIWPAAPNELPRYRYLGELHGETRGKPASLLGQVVGLIQGEAKALTLKRPYSGYTDAQGRVYVSDLGLPGVFVFDMNAQTMTLWRDATARQPFVAPAGISEGPDGEIWVSDSELAQVFRFSRDGEPLGSIGAGWLQRPIGLAFDPQEERVYIADSRAHAIIVVDRAGRQLGQLGGRGEQESRFNYPGDIAFRHGRLYVGDTMNARVQVMTPDGEVMHSFGNRGLNIGNTPRPKGVAADSEGNVYVVESYFGYLLVYNARGQFLLPISGQGRALGEFYLPAGVWVDSDDRIYLADMFNGRVVMLQYLGGD